MKFCILIPVFNGDKTIKALIEKIRVFTDDIIVVDDGSTDNTAMIAKESKVIIISHSKNKGKGNITNGKSQSAIEM